MNPPSGPALVDWARRVNRTWMVRGNLSEHAAAWLDHLEALGDGRLERSAAIARAMCAIRAKTDDPKPWFYAGLFSLASPAEARFFLATHRITKAAIPAMEPDPDVILWLDRVSPETRDLISRLRLALRTSRETRGGWPR